jgi:DNA replication protein DnaC
VPDVTTADCPDCEGRGWRVIADGGAGTAHPCPCRERDLLPRLEQLAGIPERYQGCRLDNFQVRIRGAEEELMRARQLASRYVEGFVEPDGRFRQGGLLFVGRPGVGKTHLAAAVLLELIRRYRVRGRFEDFTTLIYQIQSTFAASSQLSKSGILEPVMAAEVLVLDELGAQKPSAWVSEVLYLILNTRYTRRLPTLFTTNYWLEPERNEGAPSLDRGAGPAAAAGLEQLSSRIPAMLVSRLYEMAQLVTIRSTIDYRQTIRSHQHQV